MTYFNRLNDVYFKSLFTNERNKQIAICFLNDILGREGKNVFADIEFLDKENAPDFFDGKDSILDIRAKTDDETEINIEVQVRQRKDMKKRSLYYWSKIYASQLGKGDNYTALKDTIVINLLNFKLLPYKIYHNVYHITNDETHDRLLSDFEMHFVELSKFKLGDIRKLRKSDKWAALFSGKCTKEELEEIAMNTPAIKEALGYEKYFNQDTRLRREYELREMAERDRRSEIELSIQEGIQRGIQKGKLEGIQEGIQKGIENNVINGLRKGRSIDVIADITGLSEKEIEHIRIKHKL